MAKKVKSSATGSTGGIPCVTVLRRTTQQAGNESAVVLPKPRVVAYCRVSSAKEEQLSSVRAQIEYYNAFISKHDEWTFGGIYADEGVSGTDASKRPEFQRLLADCRTGKIDLILTKSISRFGRNTLDCLTIVRELKSKNIEVWFEKENIHTMDGSGELLLTLLAATAEAESLAMSENVVWGKLRKAECGDVNSLGGAGKFLGYDKRDGQFVINEEQTVIVRRIYQMFLDGYGSSYIANTLDADDVPMAYGGKHWCNSHIRKVLRNEKYKGDALFNKTYIADVLSHKRVKNDGTRPQYYFQDVLPAIIDPEIWECVRLEIARQLQYKESIGQSSYKADWDHPLTCKIVCGTCGRTYQQLQSKRKGDEGRRFWRCTSFHGEKGVAVEGQTFTEYGRPIRHPDSPNARYNLRRLKPKVVRQMLCTDIELNDGVPEAAFVEAWNRLVTLRHRYVGRWQRLLEIGDALTRYRVRELMRLTGNGNKLASFDGELVRLTIECLQVYHDRIVVRFLAGTNVVIDR